MNQSFVVSWPNYEFSRHSDRRATAKNVAKFRASIKQEHEKQSGSREPAKGRVALSLWFYTPEDTRDVDTLAKDLMDALTGVVYQDDRQVVELHAFIWRQSSKPRVEVGCEILGGDRLNEYLQRGMAEIGVTTEEDLLRLKSKLLPQSSRD